MTKVIVNATNKGGEGKTTNTIVLGEYLALRENKKVLTIDLDPQANCSGRYVPMIYDPSFPDGKMPPLHPDYEPEVDIDWDGRSDIANIFYGEVVIPYPTFIKNIEIAPAHSRKLDEAERVTKNDVKEKVHLQLKRFIEQEEVQKEYDVIIIDTPPSKGPLTISAFKAATHLIIPAQMEQFSIEGIYGMLQLWKQETYSRSNDNPIELVGILPNQVRNINLHKHFLNDLRNKEFTSRYVIPYEIKKRAVYTEILAENANPNSIFEMPKNSIELIEYERVCKYITEKVFQ